MKAKAPTKLEREHMAKVKSLACIVCNNIPVDIHHAGTGMGGRRDHMKVLPLCQRHHTGIDGIHTVGRKIFALAYGTENELLTKLQEWL